MMTTNSEEMMAVITKFFNQQGYKLKQKPKKPTDEAIENPVAGKDSILCFDNAENLIEKDMIGFQQVLD